MTEHDNLKIYGALVATVLFWGFSFVATKVALESIPAFTLIFGRFVLAFLFFALLSLRRGMPRFSPADHAKLFLMSLFEPGLYFLFETLGLLYTSAAKVSLIIATIPVAVMVFSALFLKEKTHFSGISGVFLSLLGITVLIIGGPDFDWALGGSLKGDLFAFGAVLSAAIYIVCARNLGLRYSSRAITTMQTFYGALFFAPAFVRDLSGLSWTEVSLNSLISLFYLTVFATFAAFLCYNYALTKVAASRAAIFINGIPVVTAVGAWCILGERLTPLQAAGGALVLIAVFVTNRTKKASADSVHFK